MVSSETSGIQVSVSRVQQKLSMWKARGITLEALIARPLAYHWHRLLKDRGFAQVIRYGMLFYVIFFMFPCGTQRKEGKIYTYHTISVGWLYLMYRRSHGQNILSPRPNPSNPSKLLPCTFASGSCFSFELWDTASEGVAPHC